MAVIKNRIKQYIEESNMSQNELSTKAEISSTALNNIIKGKSQPNINTAIKLAKILGTTVDQLFYEVEEFPFVERVENLLTEFYLSDNFNARHDIVCEITNDVMKDILDEIKKYNKLLVGYLYFNEHKLAFENMSYLEYMRNETKNAIDFVDEYIKLIRSLKFVLEKLDTALLTECEKDVIITKLNNIKV